MKYIGQISKVLMATGVIAGFGSFFYSQMNEHVKNQNIQIQKISDQFQKNKSQILSCSKKQEMFISNNEKYTKNLNEILLIEKKINEKSKVTQQAKDRLSQIIMENKRTQNLISTDTSLDIKECIEDVLNHYRQIEIELEIEKAEKSYKSSNNIYYENNSFRNFNESYKNISQEIINNYFDSDNKKIGTLIEFLEKEINTREKIEKTNRSNIEAFNHIIRQEEIKIEGEISKRKNENFFKKWIRSIF